MNELEKALEERIVGMGAFTEMLVVEMERTRSRLRSIRATRIAAMGSDPVELHEDFAPEFVDAVEACRASMHYASVAESIHDSMVTVLCMVLKGTPGPNDEWLRQMRREIALESLRMMAVERVVDPGFDDYAVATMRVAIRMHDEHSRTMEGMMRTLTAMSRTVDACVAALCGAYTDLVSLRIGVPPPLVPTMFFERGERGAYALRYDFSHGGDVHPLDWAPLRGETVGQWRAYVMHHPRLLEDVLRFSYRVAQRMWLAHTADGRLTNAAWLDQRLERDERILRRNVPGVPKRSNAEIAAIIAPRAAAIEALLSEPLPAKLLPFAAVSEEEYMNHEPWLARWLDAERSGGNVAFWIATWTERRRALEAEAQLDGRASLLLWREKNPLDQINAVFEARLPSREAFEAEMAGKTHQRQPRRNYAEAQQLGGPIVVGKPRDWFAERLADFLGLPPDTHRPVYADPPSEVRSMLRVVHPIRFVPAVGARSFTSVDVDDDLTEHLAEMDLESADEDAREMLTF